MHRLACFLGLLAALPAAGQDLEVVATSPAAGEHGVAMQTTVTFTFSAPIDTSARFDGEGPLAFYTTGSPGALTIDRTYASADLTQISFDVVHGDTTDYVWVLTGALGQDGTPLCTPGVLSYTTRPARGTAVVSGWAVVVVAVKSGSCAQPWVAALLDAPPGPDASIVAAAPADAESEFEMTGVRPGTYWPVLLLDWDRDGLIRPDWSRAGDVSGEVGVYDPDFDMLADSVVVSDTSRLEIIVGATGGSTEGVAELPGTARLLQNYPNPFGDRTMLAFELERPLEVAVVVYDLLGRQVALPARGFFVTGRHEVAWATAGVPPGPYVVRLEGDGFALARMLVRVR